MKVLLGSSLIVGGCCGLIISLLGSIIVTSSLMFINGVELSPVMLIFSIIALIGGIYTFFTD